MTSSPLRAEMRAGLRRVSDSPCAVSVKEPVSPMDSGSRPSSSASLLDVARIRFWLSSGAALQRSGATQMRIVATPSCDGATLTSLSCQRVQRPTRSVAGPAGAGSTDWASPAVVKTAIKSGDSKLLMAAPASAGSGPAARQQPWRHWLRGLPAGRRQQWRLAG